MALSIFENNPEDSPDEQFIHIQQAFNGIQQWSRNIGTDIALRNVGGSTAITTSSTTFVNLINASFTLQNSLFRIDINLQMTSPGTTLVNVLIDGQAIGTISDAINSSHLVCWFDSLNLAAGRHVLTLQWRTSTGTATLNGSKIIITSYPN